VLEIVKREAIGTSIDAWPNHAESGSRRCQERARFLSLPGGVRALMRRYFGYVLVSIGWIALAAEKQEEGSLAAAGC